MCVPYQGYEERVFEAERSGDGEHGVEAAQQSPEQDELPNVRLHGQTCQVETQRRQVLCVVQGVLTHSMHVFEFSQTDPEQVGLALYSVL